MNRALAALVAPILCSCLADALLEPAGYTFYDPPAVYATWWAETARCAGVRADFGRVAWGVMEDDSLGAFWAYELDSQGRKQPVLAAGLWVAPHLILVSRPHLGTEYVVRHEMLHDLLQIQGHGTPLFPSCCLSDRGTPHPTIASP